jgi:hypothetical protein
MFCKPINSLHVMGIHPDYNDLVADDFLSALHENQHNTDK